MKWWPALKTKPIIKWCEQHGYPEPCIKCAGGMTEEQWDSFWASMRKSIDIRTLRCDIDNTICATEGNDYENAQPDYDRIKRLNKYYDSGWHVIMWTGRGNLSGIDWSELTKKQLKEWGVKYHELQKKPDWDLLFDDKAENARVLD